MYQHKPPAKSNFGECRNKLEHTPATTGTAPNAAERSVRSEPSHRNWSNQASATITRGAGFLLSRRNMRMARIIALTRPEACFDPGALRNK